MGLVLVALHLGDEPWDVKLELRSLEAGRLRFLLGFGGGVLDGGPQDFLALKDPQPRVLPGRPGIELREAGLLVEVEQDGLLVLGTAGLRGVDRGLQVAVQLGLEKVLARALEQALQQ